MIEMNRTMCFMFTPMRWGREEIDATLLPEPALRQLPVSDLFQTAVLH